MSLVFCDGFDDGMSNEKWTRNGGPFTIMAGRNGNGGLTGNQNVFRTLKPSEEHATIIVGGALNIATYGGGWTGTPRFLGMWSDAGTVEHISVGLNAAGVMQLFRGATQIAATPGIVIAAGINFYYVELKVVLNETAGSYEVKVNGSTVLGATSVDTKNGGVKTVIDTVRISTPTGNSGVLWDDMYICNGAGSTNNDFLGDIAIETLYPTAPGNSTQWTPSTAGANHTLVDEPTPNITDFVSSTTINNKDTYGFGDLTRTSGVVRGVQVGSYAHNGDTGSISYRHIARSGASESTGATNSLVTTWKAYTDVYEATPGGGPWTIPSVNSAEFGVEQDS